MHLPQRNATSTNPPLASLSLRAVSQLSYKKTVQLDITKPAGIPDSAFRTILDAHNRRTEYASLGKYWSEKDDANLLQSLASLRGPTQEPESDPILWLLRTRRSIRQAALPLAAVQHEQKPAPAIEHEYELGGTTYQAMAAWACRRRPHHTCIREVCQRLYDEILSEGRTAHFHPIQDKATRHRILWHLAHITAPRRTQFRIAVQTGLFPS